MPVVTARSPTLQVDVQVDPANCEDACSDFLAKHRHEPTARLPHTKSVQELRAGLHSKRRQMRARTDTNLTVTVTQAVSVSTHAVRGDLERDTAYLDRS
jgi:hypothetical protein